MAKYVYLKTNLFIIYETILIVFAEGDVGQGSSNFTP